MYGGGKHVFVYHGSWATYRSEPGKFNVSDFDPKLCDHALYAFFGIDASGSVIILDRWLDLEEDGGRGNIRRFNELKRDNPSLKTLASIGGDKVPSSIFSQVAASSSLRSTFASNAKRLCQEHGFDGVDIDWEVPSSSDRCNFVQLLAALASELHGAGLILTVAVAASEFKAAESYDIAGIARYVDYINLMTYDYNGSWDSYTGHNAPLYVGPSDTTDFQQKLNIDHSVKYWLRQGAPAHKLILGVPAYGRTFRLSNAHSHGLRAASCQPGYAAPCSKEPGIITYYEACKNLQNGWTRAWDHTQKVPYAYCGDQWMSYDDSESIADKCKYAVNQNLGGVMMWTIDMDDFRGQSGRSYPLLKTINQCLGR
ncbi:acidic mammalian chitinase-like [Anopheles aquasalis]|uniref:acidic mammalian chitinase-like n=1 Tax=Anopheles aquasalis TaxID=42839 RepID=UPI00215B4B59|nr:acidic mammalian chitinase-like [Anopheles aquasalis]XP_050100085.1 acidic mammalian chitinase-like [Anopheles aquasalis]XP_050100086.1 acidic mammalian chitinase-like [Anopheles aquasalis]XP_050100087.1 acidic mammalian chitinase-like [Anopheles aquasalis]